MDLIRLPFYLVFFILFSVIQLLVAMMRYVRPVVAKIMETLKAAQIKMADANRPAKMELPVPAKRKASRRKRKADAGQRPLFDLPASPSPPSTTQQVPQASDQPAAIALTQAAPAAATKRQSVGYKERVTGVLTGFGVGTFRNRKAKEGEAPTYESFHVRLENDDGGSAMKLGVELEAAIENSGAKVGDHVELLFYGKAPVTVDEHGKTVTKYRNRWEINRL